jgi:hypothetical protein
MSEIPDGAGPVGSDPSEPLPPALRAELAAHLGTSLERVRVHRGARAETVTRAPGALAITAGDVLLFFVL